jgi:putative addiction module antidote
MAWFDVGPATGYVNTSVITRPAMIQLKLTKIGNSVGIVLPKELLAQLKVGLGDTLFCSEVPDGVKMTAYDESVVEDLNLAEEIMRSRRNVLRALAK